VETLQEQLMVVNAKIEAIHQKIEVISAQIAELLVTVRPGTNESIISDNTQIERPSSRPVAPVIHRDILQDEAPSALDQTKGQIISHEIQMQRLMAQLTAAYNRIAALEEQLLSKRLS
jgi:chromosome segregation ATPase